MKYCPKCGASNDDNNEFCCKCGNSLSEKKDRVKTGKEQLFTAHLLNILAVLGPILFLALAVLLPDSNSDTTSGSSDGGLTIRVSPSAEVGDATFTRVAIAIGFIIFIIGLLIYFLKSAKMKIVFSYIYLFTAVADLLLLVAGIPPLFIAATCGMSLIMYIPGILQIVAGVKFVKGAKEYAAE